jgi:two-component system response regulator HydG
VDTRTVAATNRSIEREVEEKRFRQDLYYRLAVVTLRVPPLRERLEDVPLLAQHFLDRANQRSRRHRHLTPAALEHLLTHAFPGNVRELENLVEQAAALAEGEELGPADFPLRTRVVPSASAPDAALPEPSLAEAVSSAERAAILATVERHPGDLSRVSEVLGVSSTTLWRKMKRLGLSELK